MMTTHKLVITSVCALGVGAILPAQAETLYSGTSVNWSAADCGEAHLRISSDDIVINRSFESCANMTFPAVDDTGQSLADGLYHFELSMVPQTMVDDQEALQAAMDASDEAAFEELSNRLMSYAVTRDAGMFRVSGGVASEYNETVYEAEAEAEAEAEKAGAVINDEEQR